MPTTRRLLPTLLLATALLGGCSSAPLDSTETVCDDFAAHAQAGLPAADRADVVASIDKVIANADQGLQDAYPTLQRTVNSNDDAYRLAADTFAQACFDAGWES